MRRSVSAILVALVLSMSALAQTNAGRLVGTVSGPDGVIPGATITAVDDQTKREITAQASGEGAFVIPQLEFGTYTVRITAQGFKTFVATDLKIDVGREYSLNPTLEVGGIEENVTVVAGADTINAANGEISNTVSPIQIQELPLDGRSPLSLIPLQAGTAQTTGGTTFINGQRTSFSNVTRDGINVQDNFIRANATDFSPERASSDDTGEFTIVTQNAGAESGYGAAQVQLVTPRGGSEINGALYIYNRNSRFAANDFFNNAQGRDDDGNPISPRPFLNRNQFGGKISGPLPIPRFGEGGPALIKGKGFFFFNYEKQFLRQGIPVTRTVLRESARNGIFTFVDSRGVQRTANVFSLPTSGGVGATAPTSINPFIRSTIIDPSPLPNSPGGGLNTGIFGVSQGFNSDYDYYTTRLDYDINDRHTINGVYTDKREQLQRPDVSAGGFSNVSGVIQPGINRFMALSYRFTPTANFSNEARGGFSFPEATFNRTDPVDPFFINSALVSEPIERFLNQGRTQRNYNIQDNASLTRGNHSLRFGGVGQFFRINPFNDGGIVPTFQLATSANSPQITAASFAGTLPSGTTVSSATVTAANNLLALLGGIIGSGAQTFNPVSQTGGFSATGAVEDFKYENYGFYFNDQWRALPELTLNLGLRYELTTPISLGNGLLLEPILPEGTDPVQAILNPSGGYQFIGGNAGSGNRFHKTDRNNFAPVASFAYSPQFKNNLLGSVFGSEGRSVIRGGFRISYVQDQILTSLRNAGRGNAGLGATSLGAVVNGSTQLNLRAGEGLPTISPPAAFTLPRTFAQNNSAIFNNFGTVFAIDPNLGQSRTTEYSLGFQREIGFQTAIEVRYVGSRSNNLLRAIDFNQVEIFSNGFFADFERARANFNRTGNAFCTSAGCQPLTIFGTGANSRIRVGTGANAVSSATFANNLTAGTPGQLAFNVLTVNADTNAANGQFPLIPNPGTGVADLVRDDARFRYNSLQLEVRRRFAQGLYFQANYTFSKNLTDAVGTSQALFDPRLDNAQPELEYSRADFDQTHAFNFNSIFELPFGRGKRFLDEGGAIDKIFGGFKLNTLLRLGSGPPVTITDTRGTLNRGGRSTRQTVNTSLTKDEIKNLFGNFDFQGQRFFINPEVLQITPNGDGTFTSQASLGFGQDTFAGQVFFNPEPGQTGNLERAFINGPKQFNLDAAIVKDIQLTEGTRIQLRAEAFNITNRVNFNYGQFLDIGGTTFGQLDPDDTSGAYVPRRLQFAFRFEF